VAGMSETRGVVVDSGERWCVREGILPGTA
jgi:hypothetical protein